MTARAQNAALLAWAGLLAGVIGPLIATWWTA